MTFITDPWQGLLTGDPMHIATQGMLYFEVTTVDISNGGDTAPTSQSKPDDLRKKICIYVWKDDIEYKECKYYNDLSITANNVKIEVDYSQEKPKVFVEILGK